MGTTLGIVATRNSNLLLRGQPSRSGEILGGLAKGTAVQILETADGWLRVRVRDQTGWVSEDFVVVQDAGFERRPVRPLDPAFERLPELQRAVVEQALQLLGNDVLVFDSLRADQQRDCWGSNFLDEPGHLNHKDIVCADLVHLCLTAAGVETEWRVTKPRGTQFKTHHAANYYRPNRWLTRVARNEPWKPGDILIYWDGALNQKRIRHVNLYVGPFAGSDIDGRLYPVERPADVVNASIDYRNRRGKEAGTFITGVDSEQCIARKFGRQHVQRLRHVELAAARRRPAVAPSRRRIESAEDHFAVPSGQLTFDVEGQEMRGPFFSRVPHVPGPTSGVTIGRGYDLKLKRRARVLADMEQAGISRELAERFAGAIGKRGNDAKDYIESELVGVEITPAQQEELFLSAYADLERDVIRICNKADVVRIYGRTDWETLHPAIRDVTVDLRYRGDYRSSARKRIQKTIAQNDLSGFAAELDDENFWRIDLGAPRDRFERRREYLRRASG